VGNYTPAKAARSMHMRQWDDWQWDGKRKRLVRKAGSPDEPVDTFDDLVEEVQI